MFGEMFVMWDCLLFENIRPVFSMVFDVNYAQFRVEKVGYFFDCFQGFLPFVLTVLGTSVASCWVHSLCRVTEQKLQFSGTTRKALPHEVRFWVREMLGGARKVQSLTLFVVF